MWFDTRNSETQLLRGAAVVNHCQRDHAGRHDRNYILTTKIRNCLRLNAFAEVSMSEVPNTSDLHAAET